MCDFVRAIKLRVQVKGSRALQTGSSAGKGKKGSAPRHSAAPHWHPQYTQMATESFVRYNAPCMMPLAAGCFAI